jgi:hypothetical protein
VVRDKELSTSKKAPVEIETKTSLNGLLINHWRLVHSNPAEVLAGRRLPQDPEISGLLLFASLQKGKK